ncbi:MAG: rhomboid family intramembrane serine protease [Thermoguttaceae bacterium]
MGIYDRDYYRRPQQGFSMRMPRTIVATLVAINVALWLIDGLFFSQTHALTKFLSLSNDTLQHPWLWWQFITYGFVHSPQFMHILFNMLQLWWLGFIVEDIYGSKEFLRLYLTMLVLGSLSYALFMHFAHPQDFYQLLGASGAISGVVILFVLNMPQATLMLFPIPIPVKAWVIGVVLVVFNLFGASQESGNVAYGVHLAGIIFAWIYFQQRWNLGRFFSKILRLPKSIGRPKFRVHHPDEDPSHPDLHDEVDRILEKISREGESSLSRKERRILETASRQYQKKHD